MLTDAIVSQLEEMGFPIDLILAARDAGCSTADGTIVW
jgi:hypothetical protein